MKIRNLFLTMLIIAGTLVSCNKKEETPVNPQGNDQYISVALQLAAPATRAETDGIAAEQKINHVHLFLINGSVFKSYKIAVADFEKASNVYTPKESAAVVAPEGSYDVYVASNLTDDQAKELADAGVNAFTTVFTKALEKAAEYSNANNFVSTGKAASQVSTQATKSAAVAAPAAVDLDRVVGRVSVLLSEGVKDNSAVAGGTVSGVSFKLGNRNTKLHYVNPTEGQDPNYNVTVSGVKADAAAIASFKTDYVEKPLADDFVAVANDAADYALENTNSTYHNGNTTYVLIKATYKPTGVTLTEGTTFYVGNHDNKIYATEAAAKSANASNDKPIKYADGVCYYYVWVGQEEGTKNAPFKRNHLYEITVTKINGVGSPSDPVSGDPDAQPTPVDPELKPEEPITASAYIAAKVTLKPWTYIQRNVEL